MRIPVVDAERVKAAARLVARDLPSVQLAQVHAAFARAIGYRDWSDFVTNAAFSAQVVDLSVAEGVITSIALQLGAMPSDVQYAVSHSRMLDGSIWSLEQQLRLHADVLRGTVFGPPARGKPGTVVRLKAAPHRVAYLRQFGQPTELFYDYGPGWVADFEISTPRRPIADFVPLRLWIPYGFWILKDGSEVIFSRDYKPMWRVAADRTERLDPWLWINGISSQSYLFDDADAWTGPALDRARSFLAQRRINGLPRLVDALPPLLLDPDARSIDKAVELLRDRRGNPIPSPFAAVTARFAG